MPTLTIHSDRSRLSGFRYFWLKTVRSFNPSVHCARCLVGDYHAQVKPDLVSGQEITLDYVEGTVLYLCGVSTPYRWANNLHLPMQVDAGVSFFLDAYTGDRVVMKGARFLPFDERAARQRFPHLGSHFLTCRNFQFGAHHFRG
jgi:hypothetical protein